MCSSTAELLCTLVNLTLAVHVLSKLALQQTDFFAGPQLAAYVQAISRRLAVLLLIAVTCGLQAMALIVPPPADSLEVAALVWYAPTPPFAACTWR